MKIKPIHIREADAFVKQFHRHSKESGNGKFAVAAYKEDELIGVAIGGRPRSRYLDDGKTFEIYRVCTSGVFNSTSFLYNRMKRIAQLMGYEKFITYTLQSESGASLRAVGGRIVKDVNHKRDWNDSKGVRRQKQSVSQQLKFRWEL